MSIFEKFINNSSKPKGLSGKLIISMMNSGHTPVSRWGMSFIPDKDYLSIADIGCGGGINIKRLLKKYESSKGCAVDYSNVSIEKTKKVNKEFIENDRLKVYEANVEELPFKDEQFDLITAFETVYFWPGPLKSFAEVNRVLKNGGTFVIVCEVGTKGKKADKWTKIVEGMTVYTVEELDNFLKKTGFSNLVAHKDGDRICVICEKYMPVK